MTDSRGGFSKILPENISKLAEPFLLNDAFITESIPGVIRGMHFQTDNAAGSRLVHVMEGSIVDVLIDLRIESATHGEVSSQCLTSGGIDSMLIPGYVAHGFEAITNVKLLYLSDKLNNPNKDKGFNPLSINFEWTTRNPIISNRDLGLPIYLGRDN